jgi:predicted alpha/beta superfamily hydrolase
MKTLPIFISLLCLFINTLASQNQEPKEIILGQEFTIYSDVLSEERIYYVSLPASYQIPNNDYKKYPLLIVLDGNYHFEPASGVVHFMGGAGQIPEMIVVGIKNVNRERDYTPDKIKTVRKNDMGGGDNFLAFLEQELIPELDQNYRTLPFRILAGHSLGGLLATHAYMKEKTLFNAFISIDPSFGSWDEETMDKKVAAVSPLAFGRSIYWASANSGSGKARNEDRHQRLFHALKEKSAGPFQAEIEYFEDENHRSVPLIAWYRGLLSIFKGYHYPYNSGKGIEDLVNNYEAISTRLSFSFPPPERLVNRIGYRSLNSRNEADRPNALDFFILNTQNYPSSYNAFDSLAEAYVRLGKKEEAIRNYKKALALNPEYRHAADQIKKLSEK